MTENVGDQKTDDKTLTLLHQLCLENDAAPVSDIISQHPEIINAECSKGKTALCHAVESKNVSVIRCLLNVADIDTNKSYKSPLHFAAQAGMKEVTKLLIQKYASVNILDKDGNTPLDLALMYGHKGTVKILLSCNGTSRKNDLIHKAVALGSDEILEVFVKTFRGVNSINDNGMTPLHVAAEKGTNSLVEALLKLGANIAATCKRKWTALHYAVKYGSTDVAETLLANGAALEAADDLGMTPLHLASKKGDLNVFRSLMKFGPSVNASSFGGLTPLHFAALNDHLNIVSHLLTAGAFINPFTVEGLTPLNLAVLAANREVTNALIEQGAFLNHKGSIPPLHLAAVSGFKNVTTILIQNTQALEEKDLFGKTPVYWAAEKGNLDVMKTLLKKGASFSTPCTDKNKTPLHIAAQNGHPDVVNYLLCCGEDPNVRDIEGNTPLHLAVLSGDVDTAKQFAINGSLYNTGEMKGNKPLHLVPKIGKLELLSLMIEQGADITKVNTSGNTILHEAAANGRVEMIKILINTYKMSADSLNNSLALPIHLAVKNGHEPASEYLITLSDINTVDIYGYSPLHYATKGGFFNIVKLLIEKKCNKGIVPKDRKHLLHLAAECRNDASALKIMQYLVLTCEEKLDTVDVDKRTILHAAVENGLYETTKWLLHHNVIPVFKDMNGNTPLHLAVLGGNVDTIKVLATDAARCNATDNNGNTPLYFVLKNGTRDVLLLMVKKGANLMKIDQCSNTALHVAAIWGRTDMVMLLSDFLEIPADNFNSNKQKPIHLAVMNGHEQVVKCLVNKTKDINSLDSSGYSPLHYAVMHGFLNIVEVLVENKCDVLIKTETGKSALHVAAEYKDDTIALKMVQCLTRSGAPLEVTDNSGCTPLYNSVASGHYQTTIWLLNQGANPEGINPPKKEVNEAIQKLLSISRKRR